VFPRPHGKKGFAQAVPNRQACEAVRFERAHGLPLARSAGGLRPVAHHLHALAPLGRRWRARARRPGHLGGPPKGRRL
jgi:hypothetical protein